MPSMSEWYDMRTSAERLKQIHERLDTVWGALDSPAEMDWDATRQEFLALLDDLARGAQSSEMWATVARWAGEKA